MWVKVQYLAPKQIWESALFHFRALSSHSLGRSLSNYGLEERNKDDIKGWKDKETKKRGRERESNKEVDKSMVYYFLLLLFSSEI